jgi:hypothetical protein
MGVSGQRHAPAALCPGERTPGTHCTGGWVDLRAGLDTEARGKIICPRQGSTPDRQVVQPVVRHYTAWANPAPVSLCVHLLTSSYSDSCLKDSRCFTNRHCCHIAVTDTNIQYNILYRTWVPFKMDLCFNSKTQHTTVQYNQQVSEHTRASVFRDLSHENRSNNSQDFCPLSTL